MNSCCATWSVPWSATTGVRLKARSATSMTTGTPLDADGQRQVGCGALEGERPALAGRHPLHDTTPRGVHIDSDQGHDASPSVAERWGSVGVRRERLGVVQPGHQVLQAILLAV